ncbi:Protein kinase superfamily protein [Striga hermonthica]|uniref:non-specific serine/threonine protein kinase n=1 Tax=Striga hermonthica TaxID=68872 RepID=A0A9N7R319_STRHE|nr:Protein kinase superfamily protein [Striga hermonthica]
MWRFKPFAHKEQTGLEGRVIEIGNFKVQVRNSIAEGGFSCVYLARDTLHGSKQYALKHIICNDEESQELVMKEISVMKSLKGHPNVVTLHAHAIFDMGRTKEALLLMEYCEKSLVNVLDTRGGAGFFEEKQVLAIFRDVCNAVFAMHCQKPPIAHRDLKAENLLLGPDGLWKLCDFGSTSTNHKRFERPEEMGIEEDNIRKHTTPAYRAPEMWDLFRRDLINEKVDIWALGCLLFRICYLKSAFDGESKLQILNGNYRIPDLPKYNKLLTDLIRDMLQSSPEDRPDITQVWFRVNDLLPDGMQKSLPDSPPEMQQHGTDVPAGTPKPANKPSPMPRRSPPPPPSSEAPQNVSSNSNNSRASDNLGPLGAFWTTQHAQNSETMEEKAKPKYDEDTNKNKLSGNEKIRPDGHTVSHMPAQMEQNFQSHAHKNAQGRPASRLSGGPTKDLNLFPNNSNNVSERSKEPKPEVTPAVQQNDDYNAFISVFNSTTEQSLGGDRQKSDKEEMLEAEVEKLKEQLAHVNAEKAEITSKYEKLSAICRSQRQEIQDLKLALAARNPSPNRDSSSRNLPSPGSHPSTGQPQNEKIEETVWDLQQGFVNRGSRSPDSKQWQAFTDNPKAQTSPSNIAPRSVRTKNGEKNKNQVAEGGNSWGFGTDTFKVASAASSKINDPTAGEFNNSQGAGGESKSTESNFVAQPAGWAGF